MTHQELREKYLSFFEAKGHKRIPSAPLIPENDPTVHFVPAGMHPLIPFLMGELHPSGKRLVNVQKCIRTRDIEEVGDDSHLTFFEMLGNWSLGDYFKKEAIEWSWEFLTDKKWLNLDKNKIAVSVFGGNQHGVGVDVESEDVWKGIFKKENLDFSLKIDYGRDENWWGLEAGGPCGPDTEMFYWVKGGKPEKFKLGNDNWMEIWNDVFMETDKKDDGKLYLLKQKNVDTGMGLERTLAILNNKKDVYETELFVPIIEKIEELSGKKYKDYQKEFRIIADHIKAATFMLAEKLEPSNVSRGYVLRRLIRRAVRYGKLLEIKESFTHKLVESVTSIYKDVYFELKENKDFIEEQLVREEEKFEKTLKKGLSILNKELKTQIIKPGQPYELQNIGFIQGQDNKQMWDYRPPRIESEWLFDFYQTFGFPPEMVFEELKLKGHVFTSREREELIDGFNQEMKKHQELSRTASAGMFKGGMADNSEMVVKYHTTTHLLHAVLRKVLGQTVEQKGSNLNAERLRFDFSYGQKMTSEQIKQVEDIINEKIQEKLDVKMEEMSLEDAKKSGAIGLFAEKYGDKVKVYSIGNFSKEICGGPHVENIGILGYFKIIKEEAVSAGVRRIKAILE